MAGLEVASRTLVRQVVVEVADLVVGVTVVCCHSSSCDHVRVTNLVTTVNE